MYDMYMFSTARQDVSPRTLGLFRKSNLTRPNHPVLQSSQLCVGPAVSSASGDQRQQIIAASPCTPRGMFNPDMFSEPYKEALQQAQRNTQMQQLFMSQQSGMLPGMPMANPVTVSYTHLTLPTICSV